MSEPAQVSESLVAVDRYQQLVKQPRETQILGFALQIYFSKIGDSMLVASNEVTLLAKFKERIMKLEETLFSRLRDPQQFSVLGDGGLDVPFVNQSFDAPFFGDIVRYVPRPKLGREATKVLSPETSGPSLAAIYASMAGLSFVRAVKVCDESHSQMPASWRGAVVGDEKVRSATQGTENYFAIPQGSIGPEDRVIIFDDVGFTGKTCKAVVQLVEKFYGETREPLASARAILGISDFQPSDQNECSITINELFLERLESRRGIDGVRYEPGRSLSSISASH